jgi:AmmeMemoRadiSam system protein B
VAGQHYFADKAKLEQQLKHCFTHELGPGALPGARKPKRIFGAIVPHGAFMFSGACAAHAYKELAEAAKPDVVVVVGPNHTGTGAGLAVYPGGAWRTPLGEAKVDEAFAKAVVKHGEMLDLDEMAHQYEPSIETQLPFIQFALPGIPIVPITMMIHDMDACDDVAFSVVDAAEETKRKVMFIATSDFSHFVPKRIAHELDELVLQNIEKLDEERLMKTIERKKVSMCGFAPVAAMLVACKEMGAKAGRVLKYYTSGEILNDDSQVNGYAAVVVE